MTAPCADQFPVGMTVKATCRPGSERAGFSTFCHEGKGPDGGPKLPEVPEEGKQDNSKLPRTGKLQLGNLCTRVGKKLELNEKGEITKDPAVNDLAWSEPRKNWDPLVTKA